MSVLTNVSTHIYILCFLVDLLHFLGIVYFCLVSFPHLLQFFVLRGFFFRYAVLCCAGKAWFCLGVFRSSLISIFCIAFSCLILSFGINFLLCVMSCVSGLILSFSSFTVISFSSNFLSRSFVSDVERRNFETNNSGGVTFWNSQFFTNYRFDLETDRLCRVISITKS